MNEPYDRLEAELEKLRPRDVSPGLKRRVAARLAVPQATSSQWSWSTALAGALAAASLAAVLLWRTSDPRRAPTPIDRHTRAPLVANGNGGPTLQVYRRALAHSPKALSALLDKHAARTLPPDPERGRIRAFTRSDELYFSNGEL